MQNLCYAAAENAVWCRRKLLSLLLTFDCVWIKDHRITRTFSPNYATRDAEHFTLIRAKLRGFCGITR